MERSRYIIATLALIIGLFGAGCTKDPTSTYDNETPTQEDETTAAEEFGPILAGEDEGFMTESSEPPSPTGQKSDGSAVVADTSYRRHGLNIRWSVLYYSSDSVAHRSYNEATTVRIYRGLLLNGSYETPRRSAEISQASFVNITGVMPADTMMWMNGGGQRHVESSFESHGNGVRKTYTGDIEWTIYNVSVERGFFASPFPTSGTIEVSGQRLRESVTPGRNRTVSVTYSYTVTFDGSQYAECRFPSGLRLWIDLTTGLCLNLRP